jgi:hypothetical protein
MGAWNVDAAGQPIEGSHSAPDFVTTFPATGKHIKPLGGKE